VRIHRLESTDAFIVFDLDDAPTAVGVTRLAPKILVDGATMLARSVTYGFASFGLQLSGGSAGINARPEAKDGAVEAYVAEVAPMAAERQWVTDAGSGLSAADLAPLRSHDPRPPDLRVAELAAAGALAAATAVVGALEGRRVAVDGTGPVAKAAGAAIQAAGATPVASDDECDVLLTAGRPGSLDHERAETIRARAVVPLAPVPVTAKAFAVLSRTGTVYVPDFVSLAAPLLAGFDPDGGDPVPRVAALASELSAEGTGMWMAAVVRAEEFLAGWQDGLPFGRPLA
jgi:glutamate dehydrogenase/leucine dehydrogenase